MTVPIHISHVYLKVQVHKEENPEINKFYRAEILFRGELLDVQYFDLADTLENIPVYAISEYIRRRDKTNV